MEPGDILGHEFCGVVEDTGTSVTTLKKGDRVVASFQIACGKCHFCRHKQSSMCQRTNKSLLMKKMYGDRTGGK